MILSGRLSSRCLVLATTTFLSSALFADQGPASSEWLQPLRPLVSPAALGSAQPQLSVSSRGVLLSWIEQSPAGATLKFSERVGSDAWSAPRSVAAGSNWFVNWADVPSVRRLSSGPLVAHWLQKSGPDTYAYDVNLSYSTDDGKTWAPRFTPHHDETKTEHGFASLFEVSGGGLGVVWLDGRQMKPAHGEGHDAGDMSLRVATFGSDWKQTSESALDARVCECCPTSVSITAEGPIVAYRDRAAGEVRDTYVTRLSAGKWTDPAPVSRDNWAFPACPVNGPSIAARGRDVAVVYFQAKDGAPKSMMAFSRDAGKTFGAPIRVDTAGSLGRADIELLSDGSAAVAFIELEGNQAFFRVKRVSRAGTVSTPVTVAAIANGRSSGYPRMALTGDELTFAWINGGREPGIALAVATLNLRPTAAR